MTKLQEELRRLRWQFKKQYAPTTAMGNLDLIEIKNQIEAIEETLEKNDECIECEGYGDTTCDECGHEKHCWGCENGLIPKNVEECGEDFGALEKTPKGHTFDSRCQWSAHTREQIELETGEAYPGSTPEEAVANLYLARKKK